MMARLFPFRRALTRCGAVTAMLGLSAYDLAPTYHTPKFILPASWQGRAPFSIATPADATLSTQWWTIFGDPLLNHLEDDLTHSNPDLQAAAERFIQARAMVASALDVARAKTQLYNTIAARLDIEAARAVVEHAIAILTNRSPSSFHIPAKSVLRFAQPATPTASPRPFCSNARMSQVRSAAWRRSIGKSALHAPLSIPM